MSCDYFALASAGVRGLQPYQPGKPIEELQRELGLSEIVKLASNENPLGPSASVLQTINASFKDLARYPDGSGYALKLDLAAQLRVETQQITLGNGSNDVLNLIGLTFLNGIESAAAIYSRHAFIVYPLMVKAFGARAIVTETQAFGHDLDGMLAAIGDDTRVIFIANPNNPTGTWFDQAAMIAFMEKVPEGVIVVLDEAYFEYALGSQNGEAQATDGLALLARFPNLIVTRTFSKAYGLAGLRVGYSVSSAEIADLLNRIREPFNVNSVALAGAQAVLADTEYLARSRETNRAGMLQLETGLQKLGFSFIPSKGNFISADMGKDALDVYHDLLKLGVIVRPVAPYEMPNHLRISVGLESENDAFLKALEQVFG